MRASIEYVVEPSHVRYVLHGVEIKCRRTNNQSKMVKIPFFASYPQRMLTSEMGKEKAALTNRS